MTVQDQVVSIGIRETMMCLRTKGLTNTHNRKHNVFAMNFDTCHVSSSSSPTMKGPLSLQYFYILLWLFIMFTSLGDSGSLIL